MKKTIVPLILLAVSAVLCLFTGCGKTYEVDYCGEKLMYDGAKDSYAPGKTVTLRYTLIASDTNYAFYLDGEKLSVEYDASKGFVIRFTMPEHNVKLECVTENTMSDIAVVPQTAEPEETVPAEPNLAVPAGEPAERNQGKIL